MPLDILTAHSILPGREDVALLLQETMRSEGWTGGRVEENRRVLVERRKRRRTQRHIRKDVGQVLGVHPRWWGPDSDEDESESDAEEEDPLDEMESSIYVCFFFDISAYTTITLRHLPRTIRPC